MEPADLFRIFLRDFLSRQDKKKLNQRILAENAGVLPKQLNAFLNKKQTLGESSRVKICRYLNIEYEDCLMAGRELIYGPKHKIETIDAKNRLSNDEIIPVSIFKNKELAREIILLMAEVEDDVPESLHEIRIYIKGMHDLGKHVKKIGNGNG